MSALIRKIALPRPVETGMTRVLHTADWHLGQRLIEQDRTEEHRAFLQWLLQVIIQREVDLLVIAGDVFDSANPPREAEALYFDFLRDLRQLGRCEVVVIAGNHDSAQHLSAPAKFLNLLGVHVVASMPPPDRWMEAVLQFDHFTLCAIPFLRERDVRVSRAGETSAVVQEEMRQGIRAHYARYLQEISGQGVSGPVIATGHLTAVGASLSDSEREIHIGNLGAIDASCLEGYAYVALGHLHCSQKVAGRDHLRYSGSPIPLSFSEADDQKEVLYFEMDGQQLSRLTSVNVPFARRLLRWKGSLEEIRLRLAQFRGTDPLGAWFEITVLLDKPTPNLDGIVREALTDSTARILKVGCAYVQEPGASLEEVGAVLEDLRPRDVFEGRLRRQGIDPASATGVRLTGSFAELVDRFEAREQA